MINIGLLWVDVDLNHQTYHGDILNNILYDDVFQSTSSKIADITTKLYPLVPIQSGDRGSWDLRIWHMWNPYPRDQSSPSIPQLFQNEEWECEEIPWYTRRKIVFWWCLNSCISFFVVTCGNIHSFSSWYYRVVWWIIIFIICFYGPWLSARITVRHN